MALVFLHLHSAFLRSRLALSIVSLYQGTTGLVTLLRVLRGACRSSSADKVVMYSRACASKSSAV